MPVTVWAPGRVRVDVLTEGEALGSLVEEWERLRAAMSASGGTRGPFLAPAWFAAYAADAPPGSVRLLVARGARELRAVLPLLLERRAIAGVPARVLGSLSDDHSQRFDLVMRPDDREAAGALLVALRSDLRWDVVEVRDAPVQGAAVDALVEVARQAGLPTGCWTSMCSPVLPLPSSRTALYERLRPKFLANLRRRRRRLEAAIGPVRLERIPNIRPDVIECALDEGFRLEAAGWKGAEGTAIASDRRLAQRYRRIALAFARHDKLALSFLTVGGQRKAFHLALLEDDVYYLFKLGYDPSVAPYGPGHLLVEEVAMDLIERGARQLDFLGEYDAWKREWTAHARPHAWRYLFAPTAFGRALAAWKLGIGPRLKRLVRP